MKLPLGHAHDPNSDNAQETIAALYAAYASGLDRGFKEIKEPICEALLIVARKVYERRREKAREIADDLGAP